MKVICNRGALLEALLVAGNVVTSRTPKPVLQCVKLTAADDKLTIGATDLEVAIRYANTQVQIEQPGEALLPADKIGDIVRESIDDTLSIEVENDTANIKAKMRVSVPRNQRITISVQDNAGTPMTKFITGIK